MIKALVLEKNGFCSCTKKGGYLKIKPEYS